MTIDAADQRVTPAPRLDYIEGLRGMAVLAVLIAHASIWSGQLAASWGSPISRLLDLGTAGVDLFFIISGFCMMWPRIGPDGIRPLRAGRFYLQRCIRIVPPYAVAISLSVGASWLMWRFGGASYWGGSRGQMQSVFPASAADLWANVAAHLTFTHGLLPAYERRIDGAFWSLSTEWQFYLLLPLLVWAARRWGPVRAITAALAASLVYAIALLATGVPWPSWERTDTIAFRFVEFGAGMLLAMIVRSKRTVPALPAIGAASLVLAAVWHAVGGGMFEPALWAIGFGSVVYAGARPGFVARVACWTPVRALGRISYSVYLIHGTVFMLLAVVTTNLAIAVTGRLALFELIAIPIAVLAGLGLHRTVELPAVAWSHRAKGHQPVPTVAARASSPV